MQDQPFFPSEKRDSYTLSSRVTKPEWLIGLVFVVVGRESFSRIFIVSLEFLVPSSLPEHFVPSLALLIKKRVQKLFLRATKVVYFLDGGFVLSVSLSRHLRTHGLSWILSSCTLINLLWLFFFFSLQNWETRLNLKNCFYIYMQCLEAHKELFLKSSTLNLQIFPLPWSLNSEPRSMMCPKSYFFSSSII